MRALDGRSVRVAFEAMSLSATAPREGMPSKQGKGDLVVHLFFNPTELRASAESWARTAAMVVMFWLFLTNPTMAIMLFFGYQMMTNAR